jgi:hypothetical protein
MLLMRSPLAFAGPHPKHSFWGAYVSWTLREIPRLLTRLQALAGLAGFSAAAAGAA